MPETSGQPVRVSVRWFTADGAYIDGETRETTRGPDLHTLIAAWSDRQLTAEFVIETIAEDEQLEPGDAPEVASRLEQIRERHAAASPPPWSTFDSEATWSLHSGLKQILKAPKSGTPYAEYWPDESDAEFLRHAPQDIEFLLERIDTSLGQLEYLVGIATGLEENGHPVVAETLRRAIATVRTSLTGQTPGEPGSEDECCSYCKLVNAPLRPETIAALARALSRPDRARYVRRVRVGRSSARDEGGTR